jgi:hypothetical protein
MYSSSPLAKNYVLQLLHTRLAPLPSRCTPVAERANSVRAHSLCFITAYSSVREKEGRGQVERGYPLYLGRAVRLSTYAVLLGRKRREAMWREGILSISVEWYVSLHTWGACPIADRSLLIAISTKKINS